MVPGENIHITPQYLPWVQNTIADAESWTTVDRFDWKLNLNLYFLVDLFASQLTAQGPVYFSWQPDLYAAPMDAFLQDWSQGMSFENPPWGLIGHILSQAQLQNAHLVLLALVWKSQPWYSPSFEDTDKSSLKQLTWKVTMLLALTRPS